MCPPSANSISKIRQFICELPFYTPFGSGQNLNLVPFYEVFKTVRLVALDTQSFFKFGLHAAWQPAMWDV